ncbi:2-oxoglutarate dehydrogenase, E2 component, dihydrolipoamide succinyltransferase [Rhodohalobacter mucosus]|uniref:Dihydrolipoamide acetyltransferase component of pyruvate dehydrogenase complex n=1 Tax=Rhodohalobacter mucosus TaxID=2079485 RepID=A0A316TZK7_9BACT|nr:2-oxoglutarate dehydrogenase, E2 component, dihydrolipoamide succinyltransferase [Rhodohalobacter mucosus]PWN05616.1 2-oxoglutarate dehydrogenase, E2 component, dihydrolipoamide succinyltransferase [Rhodohalobacter mucosus]
MAKVEVVMPQMGESVMEGTVIEWAKSVGDKVEVDETLLEIATDKVDTEVPSPEAGVLVEILVEADETVEVGQPIAIIDTDGEASAPSDDSSGSESESESDGDKENGEEEEQGGSESEEKQAEETTESQSSDQGGDDADGEKIEVVMPQMGESVMEGEVLEWLKSVGDTVEVDEPLLEIATDKVDTEVPSPEGGTLIEILVEAGETVEVGQPIAVIATGKAASGESAGKKTKEASEEKTGKSAKDTSGNGKEEKTKEPAEAASSGSEPQRMGSDGRFYSPLVRSIAKEEGISQEELETIEGSGKEGRVSKSDILQYVEDRKSGKVSKPAARSEGSGLTKPTSEPKQKGGEQGKISAGELNVKRPHENVEIIKMDRMRKMIAEHMVRSKQTSAHVSTFSEVDVTNIVNWRNANKKKFEEQTGIRLTFTPIFIEAFIKAIGEFPLINSSVDGDEIILKKDINFGLAVALGEGGKGGLIVPVIKQAQDKNLIGLAKSVAELAHKARNKELSPDDLVGGTITLTNYGSVGNLMGTPIINQPQVAILGTGVIEKRPVVMETEQGDVIAIRHIMYLTMSYDHRIIDGAHGGAFTSRVKELLENFDPKRAF